MVRFPYYCFIEIGLVTTYAQFQPPKLVFSFHKNKAFDAWTCLRYRLQDSSLEHLVYLLFKALLEMNWYWMTRCLVGRNAWVKLYTVRWARKLANSLKHIRIVCQDLFFACYQLVYTLFLCNGCHQSLSRHCLCLALNRHFLLRCMNRYLSWPGFLWMVNRACDQVSSGWEVI